MRAWLLTAVLLLPLCMAGGAASGAEQAAGAIRAPTTEPPGASREQAPTDDMAITWVDTTHAYATDQAQALTEWMDSFFGDANYDLEQPESLLRLEWANTWDEEDDSNSRVRLRGKIQLPELSKRLNLVFNGEDGDTLEEDERDSAENVGILFKVGERRRSRVDLTLGLDWDELTPGIRYRNQGPIVDRYRYRFTQRLEYSTDDGAYATGELNLDLAQSENRLVRWSNRAIYGEESDGVEWRSRIAVRQRFETPTLHDPFVFSYFATVNGVTDPNYVKNYRLGVLFRRQFFRRYFFAEIEPSYNFRKREEESRNGVWNVTLRFEILLEPDRRRTAAVLARERAQLVDNTDEGADLEAPQSRDVQEAAENRPPANDCATATGGTC
ncbi:MAG: hypothetical protein KDI09_13385 [Halioglobus sp.]|nr:hypothetical protein [Halioglobus sp.]